MYLYLHVVLRKIINNTSISRVIHKVRALSYCENMSDLVTCHAFEEVENSITHPPLFIF